MIEKFAMKQVIIIRRDLHMSVGKLASQACHACLEASERAKGCNPEIWKLWLDEGAKKVILEVDSLQELLDLQEKARGSGLPCVLITDRGLTQLPANTPTALGIGPDESEKIDKITRHLKLL